MKTFRQQVNNWLMPVMLILFVAQMVLFPLATGYAYAGRSQTPEQVLTYTRGRLTWDSGTHIRDDGTAEMNLFETAYDDSVLSGNGDDVIAPGTGDSTIVRLHSKVSGSVKYTAILFEIKDNPDIPVEAVLTGAGFTDTTRYTLPGHLQDVTVLRAVTGTLKGRQVQDFDVDWQWEYYVNNDRDIIDTYLGNRDPLDDMTVGLYIVVEDGNSYVQPDNPKTGDTAYVDMYLALIGISALLLILLFVDCRREERRENP